VGDLTHTDVSNKIQLWWGVAAEAWVDADGVHKVGVRLPAGVGEGLLAYGAGRTWEEALQDARRNQAGEGP
jgi:GTP cyclohydrolase III